MLSRFNQDQEDVWQRCLSAGEGGRGHRQATEGTQISLVSDVKRAWVPGLWDPTGHFHYFNWQWHFVFKWAGRNHISVGFKWLASGSRIQGYILPTVPGVSTENQILVTWIHTWTCKHSYITALAEGLWHVCLLETGSFPTYWVLRQSHLDSSPRSVKLTIFPFEFIYLLIMMINNSPISW